MHTVHNNNKKTVFKNMASSQSYSTTRGKMGMYNYMG